MRSYRTYGSIAGFSRSIHYSILKKPEGYSLEKVEEITSKYESDTVDKTKEHPNVIVVINEAFSDLKALSDFETNEDYMPFIHGLMNDKNCVSGTTYASIVGGQTANTEYEFSDRKFTCISSNRRGCIPAFCKRCNAVTCDTASG